MKGTQMRGKLIAGIGTFLAMIIILFMLRPLAVSNIKIKFDILSDVDSVCEVFYSETQEFSPEQSQNYEYKNNEWISVETKKLSAINRYIRIDIARDTANVRIKNLRMEYFGLEKEISLEEIILTNQIQNHKKENNITVFCTSGEDPFVVISVEEEKNDLMNEFVKREYVIYVIIAAVIGLIAILLRKMAFQIIQWLKAIKNSRQMILKLAVNDFKQRFASSYLGVVWAFVQPVVTVMVYVFVFQFGLKSTTSTPGLPFVLYLVAGIIPWFFMQDLIMNITNVLMEYTYLVKKVIFRVDLLPVIKTVAAMFIHVIFVVITIILFFANGKGLNMYIIQLPYYFFGTMLFSLGIAYFTAAVSVFFRDLTQVVNIILQFAIWLTPIMWSLGQFNIPWLTKVMDLNPMYYVVEGYRDSFYGEVWFWDKPMQTIFFWTVSTMLFAIGFSVFKKLEKHFSDVL